MKQGMLGRSCKWNQWDRPSTTTVELDLTSTSRHGSRNLQETGVTSECPAENHRPTWHDGVSEAVSASWFSSWDSAWLSKDASALQRCLHVLGGNQWQLQTTPQKMYPYTHGVRIQQTLQLIHLISSQRRPLLCRRTSHPTHVLMGDATLYLGLTQPQCLVTLEGQRHHDCLLLHLQTHFIISSWEEGLCYDLGCHGNCHQGNGPAGPRWYLRSNPSSLLLRSGRARTVSVPADGLGFKTQNTDKQSCLHKWKIYGKIRQSLIYLGSEQPLDATYRK